MGHLVQAWLSQKWPCEQDLQTALGLLFLGAGLRAEAGPHRPDFTLTWSLASPGPEAGGEDLVNTHSSVHSFAHSFFLTVPRWKPITCCYKHRDDSVVPALLGLKAGWEANSAPYTGYNVGSSVEVGEDDEAGADEGLAWGQWQWRWTE